MKSNIFRPVPYERLDFATTLSSLNPQLLTGNQDDSTSSDSSVSSEPEPEPEPEPLKLKPLISLESDDV